MGEVSLNAPSYSSVKRTSATISCSAWDWPYPNKEPVETGDEEKGSRTTYSYSGTVWDWSFSDGGSANVKEPTYTFTGLSAGTSNTVQGTLSVTCIETATKISWSTTTTQVETGKDAEGNPIYEDEKKTTYNDPVVTSETINLGSASDSVTVYTQPSDFSFGCYSGAYIADYATAEKWNLLADQVGKYKSWRDQSSQYSSYNDLKVTQGAWITADIYNSMAGVCGTATVKAQSTIISAALFEALASAVSP